MTVVEFIAWEGKKYEEFKEYANREGWRNLSIIPDPRGEFTYDKTTDWGRIIFKFRCIDGLVYPISFTPELDTQNQQP